MVKAAFANQQNQCDTARKIDQFTVLKTDSLTQSSLSKFAASIYCSVSWFAGIQYRQRTNIEMPQLDAACIFHLPHLTCQVPGHPKMCFLTPVQHTCVDPFSEHHLCGDGYTFFADRLCNQRPSCTTYYRAPIIADQACTRCMKRQGPRELFLDGLRSAVGSPRPASDLSSTTSDPRDA